MAICTPGDLRIDDLPSNGAAFALTHRDAVAALATTCPTLVRELRARERWAIGEVLTRFLECVARDSASARLDESQRDVYVQVCSSFGRV